MQVRAGGLHTVCLTDTDRVFTFGCNDDGTLGRITSEEADVYEPGTVVILLSFIIYIHFFLLHQL